MDEGVGMDHLHGAGRGQEQILLCPLASPEAMRRSGRSLFPPASMLYRMARTRGVSSPEDATSSTRRVLTLPLCLSRCSTTFMVAPAPPLVSLDLEGALRLLSVLGAAQDLDLTLDLVKLLGAETGETDPLFEQLEGFLQRSIAGLKLVDDLLQLFQRVLKLRFLGHSSLPSTHSSPPAPPVLH